MSNKKLKSGDRRANSPPTTILVKPDIAPRTFDTICQKVRDLLAAGTLKPGDKLPAERQLAEQFGVGRSALREALRTLEATGIVSLKKGVHGGAFIRVGDPSRITQVVQDLLYLGSISLENLTEARVLIQDVIVRLACQRATAADLTALDKNIDHAEKLTVERRFSERLEASFEFYRLLAVAAHNPVLSMTVDAMADVLMSVLRLLISTGVSKPRADLIEVRRSFMKKMRARDVEGAASEMKAHLISVHQQLNRAPINTRRSSPRREEKVAPSKRKASE